MDNWILERIGDRFSRRGSMMPATDFINAFDLLRRDERSRAIVDRNVSSVVVQFFQTSLHRILATFATRNNRFHLFEIFNADHFFQLAMSIFTRYQNDFRDRISALKRRDGMSQDRFTREHRKQFVEASAAAAAGRNDDGTEHNGA